VDLLELNASLPAAAVTVVRRSVEKNREERYQSARDLAFHLQQLLLAAESGPARSARRAVRRGVFLLAAAAGGALLAVAGFLGFGWRPADPTFDQLTFHRGRIGGARFSADGAAIIFSEAREGRPLELWWLSGPESPEPRYLGHRGADVLAVRAGKLGLSTGRRFLAGERFVGTLAEAPVGEGSPRELAADVEDADFDPSGREYVVARSSGAGTETRLEYPVGHVLYRTSGSIRHPRFSPDGRRIAFLEDPTGRGAGGMVVLFDLDGRRTPLTESWASARGLAWSPTGNEVWFAAGESRSSRALRAVDLQRHERVLLRTPASLTLWDIAPDGRVLLTRDEERSALVGVPPGESAERDLSWFDSSGLADLSDDGRKVLFDDRFGLYVRGTDGSPAVLLGLKDGFGDDFSPDGQRVLATTALGRQLVILPSGLGEPVFLPDHGITNHRGALWFPDGRRLLFTGAPSGGNARTYVQDLEGGAPRPLTPENAWAVSISPDGEWVAAIGAEPGIVLWPVAGGEEPRPVPSSLPGDRPVAWSADGRSLWVFRRGEVPAEVWQLDIATGRRQLWRKLQPPDPDGVYSINDFRVTRDGRAYAYSYKRVVSQLYLARGVR
jgi:Tol biopolymer transport system component